MLDAMLEDSTSDEEARLVKELPIVESGLFGTVQGAAIVVDVGR